MWWKQRRPEIVEDFEREVLGRVPKNVPKVTWTVTETADATVGGHAGRRQAARRPRRQLARIPAIDVDIQMTLVTPADAKGPVPVMMMFGGGAALPGDPPPAAGARRPAPAVRRRPASGDPPATEQLIADGWGYASINPDSIQADNGAGLTQGHHRPGQQGPAAQAGRLGRAARLGVGRVARPRLPRDRQGRRREAGRHRRRLALRQGGAGRRWRSIRASRWCWSARRAKAAPSCIAATGAKRSRTSPARGEYHWMAGNFLKYGAAEATFGSKNAGDLPVDAHELIALCAPRLTFISYGVPEKGDAKWLDQQGSFMAAVAAQPVFRLLGAKDLGVDRTTTRPRRCRR